MPSDHSNGEKADGSGHTPTDAAVNMEPVSYGSLEHILDDKTRDDEDQESVKSHAGSEGTIQRNDDHGTTNNETLVHLLKGNIGPGMLAMPEAFKNAGLWVGLAGIPIMGAICIHCMFLIVRVSKELCKRARLPTLSYEESAKMAFELGPEGVRKYAGVVHYVIMTFLVITQAGFCCVYFVFIPQNLKQAFDCMLPSGTGVSQLAFQAIIIIPILLMCYIPDLKYLAPVSLIASVIQAGGIIIIFYFLVRDLPLVHEEVPAFKGWEKMPLYFGSAIYAFEGIGLVLPLENHMKHPKSFGGPLGVLNIGMTIVVCMFAGMGFFGYLQYGDEAHGSITLNLPPSEALAQAVKIMMAVAVFLTYPLQMYVVFEIFTPFVRGFFEDNKKKFIAEYLMRTFWVLLTFVLAAAIPNIGLFISLIGAVSSSALALIFPPAIEIVTFWPDKGKYNLRLIKGILICLFGLIGFVTGTASSIQAIINYFVNGEEGPVFSC